jgi:hypothetical protein
VKLKFAVLSLIPILSFGGLGLAASSALAASQAPARASVVAGDSLEDIIWGG